MNLAIIYENESKHHDKWNPVVMEGMILILINYEN